MIYDPTTSTLHNDAHSLCKRELQRRFYLTSKTKTASTIGIVVGTLGVTRFREVITRCRNLIASAGKKSYTFVVGKINVAKLANYAEIEAFVIVACPENSLLESRDFHVPVITPFELGVALGGREWDGFYSVEFGDFLAESSGSGSGSGSGRGSGGDGDGNGNDNEDDDDDDDEDDDAPVYSMVTGKYETKNKIINQQQNLNLEAYPGQGKLTQFDSAAGTFLKNREYQGLEANVGMTEVKAAVEGLDGIASDYS